MYHRVIYAPSLAQACYLVGGDDSPRTVVIDPPRNPAEVLQTLAREERELVAVLLTHTHADFVAGHLEIQRRVRVPIYLAATAQAGFDHEKVIEGDEIELGNVRLRALLTPGHTPDSLCWLAVERAEPVALYTGDTIFVGAVGRPDLVDRSTPREQAGTMYDMLVEKILPLPDSVRIYPGHGSGSMCGAGLSQERESTLGRQRATNPFLRCGSREEFVEKLTADLPPRPAYFAHAVALNRSGPPPLPEDGSLRELSHEELARLVEEGMVAWIVDLRARHDFAEAHLPGALSMGWGGTFSTWFGTVVPVGARIFLQLPSGLAAETVLEQLQQIGVDRVEGVIPDRTWRDWLDAGGAVETLAAIDAARGVTEIRGGKLPLEILDVRTDREFAEDGIAGSVHIPLAELGNRLGEVKPDGRYGVLCRSGYRSMLAASLLQREGIAGVTQLEGGMLQVHEEAGEVCGS